jgi:hypothetical protein
MADTMRCLPAPRETFRLGVLVTAALLLSAALLAYRSENAFAVQTMPPTDKSFYVTSNSASEAYTDGCNQGTSDKNNGSKPNAEAILDFGGQLSDGSGTLTINGITLTNAQIESMAEQFSLGYWVCTGSDLTSVLRLAIGTNNSYYDVSSSGGSTWNAVVQTVKNWNATHGNQYACCVSAQVVAWGANDMEPGWMDPGSTKAWASGFSNASQNLYLNYGSADGCPTGTYSNSHCFWGWSVNCGCYAYWWQSDVYYISWQLPAAFTAPEIYLCCMENQWTMLSYYGAVYQPSSGKIQFDGPLDEWPRKTTTYMASAAWNNFWGALNTYSSTAISMSYSDELQQNF